jgi:hypothetical protein
VEEHSGIAKFIKIILLQNEEPLPYPEIQKLLREFNIDAAEIDIIKALKLIPKSEKEFMPISINPNKLATENRGPKYSASVFLERKHSAIMNILNLLSDVEEKHISLIEDELIRTGGKVNLQKLLVEIEVEGLIKYKTADHYFVFITPEGREYLKIFM